MTLTAAKKNGYVEVARWSGPYKSGLVLLEREGKTLLMRRSFEASYKECAIRCAFPGSTNGRTWYSERPTLEEAASFAEANDFQKVGG